jgi:hAT family C-terminal dimerisation region
VSIIASELCYSVVKKVLTDKRMRLNNKIFQALILLKDWDDIESRLEDKS